MNSANDATGQALTVNEINAEVGAVPVDGLDVAVQTPTWTNKGTKDLELAHVPASANSANVPNYAAGRTTDGGVAPGLSTAWIGQEATPVVHELGFDTNGAPVTAGSGNALYGSFVVKLNTKQATDQYGHTHTKEQVADDLDGKYLTLSLSNKASTGCEAIRFFANNTVVLPETANNANTLDIIVTLEADDLKVTAGQTITVYFFVLGEAVGETNLASGTPRTANAGTILASTSASRDTSAAS